MQNVEVAPQVVDEKIGNKTYQVTRLSINAPVNQIWQFLVDYKNAVANFPNLRKCQVLEDHGPTKVISYTVQPSGYPFTYDYTLEVKNRAPNYIEWHRISGDFKQVDGFWKLEPKDEGRTTLVTYATSVIGDLFTPQMLIRKSLRTDLPTVMLALKGHAERAMAIAGRAAASRNE